MKTCTVLVMFSLWWILWVKNGQVAETAESETIKNPILLNFWLKRIGSGPEEISENKVVSILNEDELHIKCTTKHVHTWDGDFNYGKVVVDMRRIERNSTGYFSSRICLNLSPDFLHVYPILVCKQLGSGSEVEIRIDIQILTNYWNNTQSKGTSIKDNNHNHSLTVQTHRQIPKQYEHGESKSLASETEDSITPRILEDTKNDSVMCHVHKSMSLKFRNMNCDNSLWCKIKINNSEIWESSVAAECEGECNLTLKLNQPTGLLECEANGLKTYTQYVSDINGKRCFQKLGTILTNCTVLQVDAPDKQLVDGQFTAIQGRASHSVIISDPEIRVIFKNGTIIKHKILRSHEGKQLDLRTHYNFAVTLHLTLNLDYIKVFGYQFDSPMFKMIKRKLNVGVGVPPTIEGLPSKIELVGNKNTLHIPFLIHGYPDPKISLTLNGKKLYVLSRTFRIVKRSSNAYMLTGEGVDGFLFGTLTITAKNVVGHHSFSAVIGSNVQGYQTPTSNMHEARVVVIIILAVFVSLLIIIRICERFRRTSPVQS